MTTNGTTAGPIEPCSWCGKHVEVGDGYRLTEPAGERRATFCRLEHVVPWAGRGPHWDPGVVEGVDAAEAATGECAHCGGGLDDTSVVLIRHRGDHRIPDRFCSVDHLAAWARAGGRWSP